MEKKKNIIFVIITYIGTMAGCFAVVMFNEYVMMSLPLVARMICMIEMYWIMAWVPIVIMIISKMGLKDIGFTKEKIGLQIVLGIVCGLIVASLYFFVPYLFGFGDYVDAGYRYETLWQFVFQYTYYVISVAAVEEIVFRGIIYRQLMNISNHEWVAIIVSSVLFGFLHIINGNMLQVIFTTILGIVFCISRYKIKRFSMISLILMHGTYDFMLAVFSSLLFKK